MENCCVGEFSEVNSDAIISNIVEWDTLAGDGVDNTNSAPEWTWRTPENKVRPEHWRLKPGEVEPTKTVFNNLGGAQVRLARRDFQNVIKIEAILPELSEAVTWTIELSNRDLGDEFVTSATYRLIEDLIYDYRVALNGKL